MKRLAKYLLALLVIIILSGAGKMNVSAQENNRSYQVIIDSYMFYATITMTPITEELFKALPVLFYAFVISDKRERLLSLSMALGIGFTVMENVTVIAQNAANVNMMTVLIRGFATGLMHGLCTAAVEYGISYVRKRKKLFYTGTFGLLSAAAIYHAIFNAKVQSPYPYIAYVLPMVTYIPVVIYIIRNKGKNVETA